jgi:uncharacterized protein (DUF433 family)
LVAAQWSNLEAALSELYTYANADFVHWPAEGALPGSTTRTVDYSHMSVFDSVESLRARLSMIAAKVKHRGGGDLAAQFDRLAADIRRRAGERATIVHGRWGTSLSHPGDLMLRRGVGPNLVRYTAADFRQTAERISDLEENIRSFTELCGNLFTRPADRHLLKYLDGIRESVVEREGVSYIVGTDIPVDTIAELRKTKSIDQIVCDYPDLTVDQIEAAVTYAQAYLE